MSEILNYASLALVALVGGSYLIEPAKRLLGELRSGGTAAVAVAVGSRQDAISGVLVALDYAQANGLSACAKALADALPELANPKAK